MIVMCFLLLKIKKITILNEVKGKRVLITPIIGEDIGIVLDNKNRIIEYITNNLKLIDERNFIISGSGGRIRKM